MLLIRAFIAVGFRRLIPFETDALGITSLLVLLLTLPLVLGPLLVVMVGRHVRTGTVVRTPLKSRTSLGALCRVPDLGVPPVLAVLLLSTRFLRSLRILSLSTVLLSQLLLEIGNLSSEGNDLGIGSARLLPAPFRNHVAIKDVEIVDDGILVGLFSCNPGVLGRANVQSKGFISSSLSRTKELSEELVIFTEVIAFVSIDLLLELFKLCAQSVDVVIGGDDGHLFHLQLQILHIDDHIRFDDHVDHAEESVAIVDDVPSLLTLIGEILLANEKSLVGRR